MAVKSKMVTNTVKIGVKYGPQIWLATKPFHGAIKDAMRRATASEKARHAAYAHAKSLSGGSILKVYEGEQSVWVVFSGDTAVSTYPVTTTPLTRLLLGVDLDKRIRPEERLSMGDRARDTATSALRRAKPGDIN